MSLCSLPENMKKIKARGNQRMNASIEKNILGDPWADSAGEGKSKRDEKYVLSDQFQTVAAVLASDWAEKHKSFLTNQKPGRRRPFGTGLVRHCPQGLYSPFFTFLRAIFFLPFRLSPSPTICAWVSKDVKRSTCEGLICAK